MFFEITNPDIDLILFRPKDKIFKFLNEFSPDILSIILVDKLNILI